MNKGKPVSTTAMAFRQLQTVKRRKERERKYRDSQDRDKAALLRKYGYTVKGED